MECSRFPSLLHSYARFDVIESHRKFDTVARQLAKRNDLLINKYPCLRSFDHFLGRFACYSLVGSLSQSGQRQNDFQSDGRQKIYNRLRAATGHVEFVDEE